MIAVTGTPLPDRRLQIFEVILVCAIAFGSSVIYSIAILYGADFGSSGKGAVYWTTSAIHEVTGLALVWYVLRRRSVTLTDLGLSFRKTDFGLSLLLWLSGSLLYYGSYAAIYATGFASNEAAAAVKDVGQKLFHGGISVMTVLFVFVNPFFEELIVRAYFITQVRHITNSTLIAVALSVLLQMTYHLYQGVPLALSSAALFLLFSIYYAKTNRIGPIILAHLYFDLLATLSFMRHG